MEPLFHFALALLSAGAPWLAAITVAAIVVASHRRIGQVGPSRWGSVRQAGALKSVFRSDSYTRQHRRRPALEFEERSVHDRIQFSIFGLFSPSSERCSGGPQAEFQSGSTTPLMKSNLKSLLSKPTSLLLLVILVLSVGFALHMAGPISIQTHRVELPDIEIHIGNTPAAEPVGHPAPIQAPNAKRKHHQAWHAGLLHNQ